MQRPMTFSNDPPTPKIPTGTEVSDFEEQIKQAIDRGRVRHEARNAAEQAKKLSEEEIRSRHAQFRLQLSEHIEAGLKKIASHFPGFRYETIYGDRGWGGALSRDDMVRGGAKYSRLEVVVRPINEYHVVNLTGKGTVRNRELFAWNHFEEISQADENRLIALVDGWMLQYAEQFAAAKGN